MKSNAASRSVRWAFLWALSLLGSTVCAQEPEGGRAETRPQDDAKSVVASDSLVAEASDSAQQAAAAFRLPEGWRASLFAAEPLVANPVAFSLDRAGRVFVCESFRQNRGVTDNREHDQTWLDADLAAMSVDDRRAYHLRLLGEKAKQYTKYDDRIRVLTDRDGDGAADDSQVFAEGFRDLVNGTGAGVLIRGQDVFFTCIPNLWLLRDQDDDGRADFRKSLHTGYGVRVAFRGHDLHGLIIGPDGRLYFSIGDRGYNIETEGRRLFNPESGAVFRCELDGSHLEVVASGLRNPQELAFDDFGNLFTGDNNSDSGDKARWVYVCEGGDSGWRMAYQYLSDRGPFNREKIWEPYTPDTPAYIVPPVANLADGPSGLQYYPGVGLSDSYRGRFFLCDFRGTPAQSGIRSFRMKPAGAFFRLSDEEQTVWRILATDLEFANDGSLFVSDWVDGWNGEGKGRIYRIFDPKAQDDDLVRQTSRLLGGELWDQNNEQLQQLLGHPDQRVRREAQFELVRLKELELLQAAATNANANLLARLHGIWGMGQVARGQATQTERIAKSLTEMLDDADPEVRAQSAKLLGEMQYAPATAKLKSLQRDPKARPKYFAALALGRIGAADSMQALIDMLQFNNNEDPILRHGGVMGLAGCGSEEALASLAEHPSMAVRQAAIVALRRQASPQAAAFLSDGDPRVALEAARAVHDTPIAAAFDALSAIIASPTNSNPLMRRVLNANFRLGRDEHALALARYAAHPDAEDALRLEALEMLGEWGEPAARDRVMGMWRPIEPRSPQPAANALKRYLAGMLIGSEQVRNKAIEVAARLGVRDAAPLLVEVFSGDATPDSTRADALRALTALNFGDAPRLVRESLKDESPLLRATARTALAQIDSTEALPLLAEAVGAEQLLERQSALADLAKLSAPDRRKRAGRRDAANRTSSRRHPARYPDRRGVASGR